MSITYPLQEDLESGMINRKQIMIRAWELGRHGATKFGGSAKLYFACALKLVWKESRKPRALWHPELGGAVYVLPGVKPPRIPVSGGRQLYLEIMF